MRSFPRMSLCEEWKASNSGERMKEPGIERQAVRLLFIITEILLASKGCLLLDQGCCIDNRALLTIPSSNAIPVLGVLIGWLRHQLDRGRRTAHI